MIFKNTKSLIFLIHVPVNNITLDQIRGLYLGKIKNWKEVGGDNKVIVVVSRDSSSGTFEVWNHKVSLIIWPISYNLCICSILFPTFIQSLGCF
ncbi:MAG: substrate-binding domain-containing protein [Candidatus Bathyarchaeota archaeon]